MTVADRRAAIASAVCLTLALFFLTLWRFGANQFLILAVVVVLIHRPWRQTLFSKAYLTQPMFLVIYLFLAWAMVSMSYSQVPSIGKALQGLTMYTKLLFFLVLPLAVTHDRARYWIAEGLILGVLVNVILSTLFHFHVAWVVEHFASPFLSGMNFTFSINPLQLIFVVALAMWLLVNRFVTRQFHWHDVLIFAILMVYLWFINIERSGYLLFIVLSLLFVWQHFNQKVFVITACLLPFLLFGVYLASPNVKARVNAGIVNVEAFYEIKDASKIGPANSLGLRLAFLEESLQEVKLHPIVGTGIGSFRYVYMKKYGQGTNQMQVVSGMPYFPMSVNDPHNAYTYIAFELGLVGLALYLLWLYQLWRVIELEPKVKHLLRGVFWAFVVMGVVDSGLALNAVAVSFVVISCSLLTKEKG